MQVHIASHSPCYHLLLQNRHFCVCTCNANYGLPENTSYPINLTLTDGPCSTEMSSHFSRFLFHLQSTRSSGITDPSPITWRPPSDISRDWMSLVRSTIGAYSSRWACWRECRILMRFRWSCFALWLLIYWTFCNLWHACSCSWICLCVGRSSLNHCLSFVVLYKKIILHALTAGAECQAL